MSKYSDSSKRDLAEQIRKLELSEQEEVFQILHRHDVFFSSNVNGIFINMKNLNIDVIEDIEAFIESLKERKARMAHVLVDDNVNDTETNNTNTESSKPTEPINEEVIKEEDLTCGFNINLCEEDKIILQTFCQNIRVDRSQQRRAMNRFTVAKKRFARVYEGNMSKQTSIEQDTLHKQNYFLV